MIALILALAATQLGSAFGGPVLILGYHCILFNPHLWEQEEIRRKSIVNEAFRNKLVMKKGVTAVDVSYLNDFGFCLTTSASLTKQ